MSPGIRLLTAFAAAGGKSAVDPVALKWAFGERGHEDIKAQGQPA